jgi:hypothetical protein
MFYYETRQRKKTPQQRKHMILSFLKVCVLHIRVFQVSSSIPLALAFATKGLDNFAGLQYSSIYCRTVHHNQPSWPLFQGSSNYSDSDDRKHEIIPEIKLDRKPKQSRRKYKNPRRPSSFWKDINNIQSELILFWISVNVEIDPSQPPTLPNEALLNHFERHDLRYAIANMGGRSEVAIQLGGAKLVPGKWSVAIRESDEVKQLLKKDNPAGKGLSKAVPPIAPHMKRTLVKSEVKKVKKHMHDMIMNSFLSSVEKSNYDGDLSTLLPSDFAEIVIPLQESINRLGRGDIVDVDIEELNEETIRRLRYPSGERWAQNACRKPRGYWDQDVLLAEL